MTNLEKELFPTPCNEPAGHRAGDGGPHGADGAYVAPLPAEPRTRYPGGADTDGFWYQELPEHTPGRLPHCLPHGSEGTERAHRQRSGVIG